MPSRRSIGNRTHTALFKRHDGSTDDYGNPTYDVSGDWDDVVTDWPCELISTVGSEIIRGKMTMEKSTHVLYGFFSAVSSVDVKCKCYIDGEEYGITSVFDPDGRRMEMRVEVRRKA